jgi:hypothetical protein
MGAVNDIQDVIKSITTIENSMAEFQKQAKKRN